MAISRLLFPPTPLNDAACHNGEAAIAEIGTNLSGCLNTLGALVGPEFHDDLRDSALYSPSGRRGHDHSGAGYGRPFLRSIMSTHCGSFAVYDPGEFSTTASGFSGTFTGGSSDTGLNVGPTLPLLVPPCDPEGGAYAELGWSVGLHLTAGGKVVGDEVVLRMINRTIRRGSGAYEFQDTAGMAADEAIAVYDEATASNKLLVRPGRLNVIELQYHWTWTSGGGTRTSSAQLVSLDFGVHST